MRDTNKLIIQGENILNSTHHNYNYCVTVGELQKLLKKYDIPYTTNNIFKFSYDIMRIGILFGYKIHNNKHKKKKL